MNRVLLLFLIALCSASNLRAANCTPPPSGLVGWWPGDGTATNYFGTNNGTLQSGATATGVGLVNQAFSFNGSNAFVQIPDSPILRPTNLTVEAWVKFSSLNSTANSHAGQQYIVFTQNTRSGNFEGYFLGKARGSSGDYFVFEVTSAAGVTAQVVSSPIIQTSVWYHVAGVRGTNFLQLYLNGQLAGQTNVSFAQDYGNFPLYFGSSGQLYWDGKLAGLLDEVSLYNRALSATEILGIYNAGSAGKCRTASGLNITGQPQSQTVAVGNNAAFNVTASGVAPLSYQWWFNTTPIDGAAASSLNLNNVQPSDGGNYTVIVTNPVGSVTSAVALLTVLVPPSITSPPADQTNLAGTTATLSATADGSVPLSYRWLFNGNNVVNGGRVSGATSSTLVISSVQSSDGGNYAMVASNAVGVVTSTVASLTVLGPPSITGQPTSRSVVAGSSTTFNVTATGTPPLSYEWRLGGAAIDGATSSSLTLNNVQPADGGNYTVVVTNSVGSVTSTVAVLTVLVPPTITTQPVSQTNSVGTTTTFSAVANGSPSLGYQWRFNGSNMANGGRVGGATSSVLSISSVQSSDAGNYTLLVSNSAGAVTSVVASLTVLVPPSITTQPTNQSLAIGNTARFNVGAGGTLPLSYQWRWNGNNLNDTGQFAGSGTSTLFVSNVQPANAGSYVVIVTNVAGAATSSVASLTVSVPGSCFSPPAGMVGWWPGDGAATNYFGTNNGTLQSGATATGVGLDNQAFSFNGSNAFVQIPDSPILRPTNLTVEAWVKFSSLNSTANSHAGQQYIVFKQNTRSGNFEGYFLGKARGGSGDYFVFEVTSAAGITAQVVSSPIIQTSVWYHVAGVRGTNFLQLYLNGQLVGQTNVSFAQDYGNFPLYFGTSGQSFWDGKLAGLLDEVSLYNRALSATEILAIYNAGSAGKCKAPSGLNITSQPQSQTVAVGNNAAFTVTASGVAPLSYQWWFNTTPIVGATASTLNLNNAQPSDGGNYTVIVANPVGSVTSAVAVLTVLIRPTITSPPVDQTNLAGTTATLSATADGSVPLSYRWLFNGNNVVNGGRVSGATSNTLVLSSVQSSDGGNYAMVASNAVGVVTSTVASLTVLGPPSITGQPTGRSVAAGSSTTFNVTATGTPPLSYQWSVDGAAVDGATSSSLTLNNVQPADGGNYAVVVTNSVGSVTSTVAVLTVLVPPSITTQPVSRTNSVGTTATFTAVAAGSQPLSYQWQLNGANVVAAGGTDIPNTWQTKASLPVSLQEVACGVIGGKMYTIGVHDGAAQPDTNSPTLVYDIPSNTWTNANRPRPFPGDHHAAVVYGGRLFLLGGLGAGASGQVQIYDPSTNGWSLGAPMPFAAGSCCAALVLNGQIYVAGGVVGFVLFGPVGTTTNGLARYDPVSNSWVMLAPMPVGRNHTASGTDGQKLYVFGGRDGGNAVANGYNTVQIYDPASNTWVSSTDPGSTLAPLPQARGGMGTAVYYNGEFYVMGGETLSGAGATANHVYNRVDIYNVASNSWRLGAPMPTARHGIYPALNGNRIYVGGGGIQSGVSSSTVLESYVVASGSRSSGVNSDTLTITNIQTSDAGNYTLVVSNAVGVVTSTVASLTVLLPPAIAAQGGPVISSGEKAQASPGEALAYRELDDPETISGQLPNFLADSIFFPAPDLCGPVRNLDIAPNARGTTGLVGLSQGPFIQSVVLNNGAAVITWSATAGTAYRVQFTEALAGGTWQDLQPVVVANGPTANAIDYLGNNPQRFYRVLVLK